MLTQSVPRYLDLVSQYRNRTVNSSPTDYVVEYSTPLNSNPKSASSNFLPYFNIRVTSNTGGTPAPAPITGYNYVTLTLDNTSTDLIDPSTNLYIYGPPPLSKEFFVGSYIDFPQDSINVNIPGNYFQIIQYTPATATTAPTMVISTSLVINNGDLNGQIGLIRLSVPQTTNINPTNWNNPDLIISSNSISISYNTPAPTTNNLINQINNIISSLGSQIYAVRIYQPKSGNIIESGLPQLSTEATVFTWSNTTPSLQPTKIVATAPGVNGTLTITVNNTYVGTPLIYFSGITNVNLTSLNGTDITSNSVNYNTIVVPNNIANGYNINAGTYTTGLGSIGPTNGTLIFANSISFKSYTPTLQTTQVVATAPGVGGTLTLSVQNNYANPTTVYFNGFTNVSLTGLNNTNIATSATTSSSITVPNTIGGYNIPAGTYTINLGVVGSTAMAYVLEIVPVVDDYRSIKYMGNMLNQASCHSIKLDQITLPNLELINNGNIINGISNGGYLDSYPYFYVVLQQQGQNTSMSALYGNNDQILRVVGKIAISAPDYVLATNFITFYSRELPSITFRPTNNLHIQFLLPNGTVMTFRLPDNVPPYPSNPLLATSAVFELIKQCN